MLPTTRPPLLFRFARWLQRNGIRGGHRFERVLHDCGYTALSVSFPIGNQINITVPLALRPYDEVEVQGYERLVIATFLDKIRDFPGDYIFIDCGADIGLMSCRISAMEPSIKRVIAFEPNCNVFGYLSNNLKVLPIASQAINSAVADFVGRGEMHFPEHDAKSEHARFLVRDEKGSTLVTAIDSLAVPVGSNVVLKIDVEGGELAVVDGAAQTLADANHFIVVFEAHLQQIVRSGIDPVEIIGRLAEICPIDISLADAPGLVIDWTKPFLPQVGVNTAANYAHTYNICVAKRREGTVVQA